MWHSLSPEEVIKKLKTNSQKGLSEKEAKKRQQEFGKNKLPEEKTLSSFKIFLEQFKSPLIYILLISGIITLFLKEYTDSIVIFAAVILNAIVGFIQENKASEALRKLKKVLSIKSLVLRDGRKEEILADNLVPGDIILLKAGDKVPADGRLIEIHDLKINEAALTGEWLPATKKIDLLPENTPLADRDNMVYMGTVVEDGRGKAVVTEIGEKTEIGKISALVKETKEEKTPYQKKLANFSKIIGIIIGVICVGIFVEGMLTGGEFVEMFTTAVAVAVAGIPEGLPVAMTLILATGMQRIFQKKGLVRRLASAETLGSTSIICSDKTGTLTEAKMQVAEFYPQNKEKLAFKIAILSSEAFVENPEEPPEKWKIRGLPTERALVIAAAKKGIFQNQVSKDEEEIDEIPFGSEYKYSASLRKVVDDDYVLYVKGAPEVLLEKSRYFEGENGKELLTKEKIEEFQKKQKGLTSKGYRLLAVAYKNLKEAPLGLKHQDINGLTLVGIFSLEDPIREDAKEAIQACYQAGMRPIIVTGDHKLTAKAIAKKVGIKVGDENILEGNDLEKLSEEEFQKILPKIQIYARVEPRHKLRIIKAWQERGEVVAMTGDGINDAPALKQADVGVALGSGTDVAKEVADLVLLTDNFSVIVAAVEEGRAILDNIRKVITYLLSDSFTEVILVGASLFLGLPLPVIAVQILWVNLIEDGPLSLSLAFEPKEKDLMEQKPGGYNTPLLTREMRFLIFIIGIVTDLFLLGLFFWLMKYSGYELSHVRSIIFAGLALDSLFYIFSCRSLRKNIWNFNPFSNKFLNWALLLGVLMLLAGIYFPPLQTLLKTTPLNLFDWGLILGIGFLNILLIEATKWYFITRHKTGEV
ncbi:MAG TPA: HAD-IC family P-type ATPase [Candidatus Pacearchaeota archaeon]|nr:HAD-IC family P-type ATPase [Candidatus Pacearchaeota archaeon]